MKKHDIIQNQMLTLMFELKSKLARAIKGNSFKIAPMHMKALFFFNRSPGATQQDMVNESGRDKAQITRLIKELENQELIVREKDTKTNRSYRIRLSKKGEKVYTELKKLEQEIMTQLLQGFSDKELDTFNNVLGKARNNLKKIP